MPTVQIWCWTVSKKDAEVAFTAVETLAISCKTDLDTFCSYPDDDDASLKILSVLDKSLVHFSVMNDCQNIRGTEMRPNKAKIGSQIKAQYLAFYEKHPLLVESQELYDWPIGDESDECEGKIEDFLKICREKLRNCASKLGIEYNPEPFPQDPDIVAITWIDIKESLNSGSNISLKFTRMDRLPDGDCCAALSYAYGWDYEEGTIGECKCYIPTNLIAAILHAKSCPTLRYLWTDLLNDEWVKQQTLCEGSLIPDATEMDLWARALRRIYENVPTLCQALYGKGGNYLVRGWTQQEFLCSKLFSMNGKECTESGNMLLAIRSNLLECNSRFKSEVLLCTAAIIASYHGLSTENDALVAYFGNGFGDLTISNPAVRSVVQDFNSLKGQPVEVMINTVLEWLQICNRNSTSISVQKAMTFSASMMLASCLSGTKSRLQKPGRASRLTVKVAPLYHGISQRTAEKVSLYYKHKISKLKLILTEAESMQSKIKNPAMEITDDSVQCCLKLLCFPCILFITRKFEREKHEVCLYKLLNELDLFLNYGRDEKIENGFWFE